MAFYLNYASLSELQMPSFPFHFLPCGAAARMSKKGLSHGAGTVHFLHVLLSKKRWPGERCQVSVTAVNDMRRKEETKPTPHRKQFCPLTNTENCATSGLEMV